MLTFRPTRAFLISPKNNQEYNREKGGVIITSSIENAKDDYKVSVTADLEIDQNATEKLRNS